MSYPYGGGGYPPAGGGYPPAGGAGYPPAAGGYPPPPAAGGYPPTGGAGYPPQPQPGYPPAGGGGYPPQQPGYPPTAGGYPPAPGGGYPGQQPGYPPQQAPGTGYPPAGGMPNPGYQPAGGLPYNPSPLGFAGAAMATTAFRPQHPAGPGMPMPSAAPPAAASYKPPSQHPPQQYQAPSQAPAKQMANMNISDTYRYRGTGTVKDKPGFDGHKEAEILRKAMKGIGTDEKAITDVLTSCSNKQRQKIIIDYKTMYGKDLISNLKGELRGKFEDIVLGLLQVTTVFDAHQLRKAMKGVGTDEAVLIEILCSRNNQQIKEIREAYKKEFRRDLEKDVISETSGHFKRLLVSMIQGGRSESMTTDTMKAREDAKALYDAGEKRWGTDESRFNAIFASRSVPQLRVVFEEYAKLSKYNMEDTVKREMSGDLERGMLTIVSCVRNTPKYFAEKLYKSMKGLGTDDETLMRCMISRCEVDMVQIKEEFKRNYKQSLGRFIAGDTSGDYKRILIALAGGEN